MSAAMLSSLALVTALSPLSLSPSVLLQNAADAGVRMPLVGMGTGCAIGGCDPAHPQPMASYNMSRQWLRLGGRRFDSADSYGIEPGIGRAIADSGMARDAVFVTSKAGPGGLCFPMGFNETIAQAEQIARNLSMARVDLLLIHWPVNWGPCPDKGPPSGRGIPTTDPLCDAALPTFSAGGCRLSSWRGMVEAWRRGLARAIGVSNFNSTMLEEIRRSGLPLPSVNQCEFSPGVHGLQHAPCTPESGASGGETCGELLDYCQAHRIVYNGYSPFGGAGHVAQLLSSSLLESIATRHSSTPSRVALRWQTDKGIPVNPEATSAEYQRENLDIFGATLQLDANETAALDAFRL